MLSQLTRYPVLQRTVVYLFIMKKTTMMELIDMLDWHISKHKDHANKFDTGAMVAKNFAMSLLDKEQRVIEDSFDMGGIMDTTGENYYKKTFKSE